MQVEHYIPKTVEEIFSTFSFSLRNNKVAHPKCIAYEGVVDDEVMAVYEIYVDNTPRFFGLLHLDHDDGNQDHNIVVFKVWSRSSEIKLLEKIENDFLFELAEPFGIHFSGIVEKSR